MLLLSLFLQLLCHFSKMLLHLHHCGFFFVVVVCLCGLHAKLHMLLQISDFLLHTLMYQNIAIITTQVTVNAFTSVQYLCKIGNMLQHSEKKA